MTNPLWTLLTEERVARSIAEADPKREGGVDEVWRSYQGHAAAALEAVHLEGLLLPFGGSVWVEHGFVYRKSGAWWGSKDPEAAVRVFNSVGGISAARRATRIAVEWPRTGGLYYGPWQFTDE